MLARIALLAALMGSALVGCTREQADEMLGEEFPAKGIYQPTSSEESDLAPYPIDMSSEAKLREFIIRRPLMNCEWGESKVAQGQIEAEMICPNHGFPTQLSGHYGPESLELHITMDMGDAGTYEIDNQYDLIEATPTT